MHMQKPVSALCAHREAVMGGRGPVSAWSKGPERQTALRAPQGKRQLLPGQERWAPPRNLQHVCLNHCLHALPRRSCTDSKSTSSQNRLVS